MSEVWHNIKGYEGLYQISNLGRVKSLVRGRRKERLRRGEKNTKIAKDYPFLHEVTISQIKLNKIWKHINPTLQLI